MQVLILEQLGLFQVGADEETLKAAVMLADDVRATKALLELLHRGKAIARLGADPNSVDDIQFQVKESV
jgi:hypothetical protein